MRFPWSLFLLIPILLAGPAVAQTDEGADGDAVAGVSIAEAVVCLDVVERAPVGADSTFAASTEQIACFTDVRGGAGRSIVHAWIHEGTTRARVELEVGGDRWRTWSRKRLLPAWTGDWQVKVMTDDGAVLETVSFTVE